MRRTRASVLVASVLLAPSAAASAQPADAEPLDAAPVERDPWRVEFTPWIWLMGVDGDLGVQGAVVEVGRSFVDILDSSDSLFALSGRLEAGYERFGVYVDGFYADLGVEDVQGPEELGDVDIEFDQTILDFGVMWRVVNRKPEAPGARRGRDLTLDLYAGGRWSALELELRPTEAESQSDDAAWVDPIVGAKAVIPFTDDWRIMVSADIGGFGVASDLTWGATGVLGYDFELFGVPTSAMIGYRAIAWDYTDESGPRRFTWDIVQHGLIIGLNFRF